ncbi:hypothetical protein LQ327_22870 [Actinomycetospora endophytica]|uniref:Uncharacterized protein n=1 Tax=Actinomycetospora endophytica TaxID=2291215 RepID=A0ABS8PD67_9PSEU|nr:hypothetical protein [Actinomycetospora endophytica]MCD2196221.1 hypothetical protein [Actinomycetospora endophytica]
MSTTEPEVGTDGGIPAVPSVPYPREPEPDALAPWSPQLAIPAPRGVRWLDAPPAPDPVTEPATRPAPTARQRRARALVGLGLVLATGAGVAGVFAVSPPTMSVPGSIAVSGEDLPAPGGSCFPEMSASSVTIFSTDGTVIGSAPLASTGTAVDRWHTRSPGADACRVTFTVTDVPSDHAHYRVGLDGNFSDTVAFSREEFTTTGAQITYGR